MAQIHSRLYGPTILPVWDPRLGSSSHYRRVYVNLKQVKVISFRPSSPPDTLSPVESKAQL